MNADILKVIHSYFKTSYFLGWGDESVGNSTCCAKRKLSLDPKTHVKVRHGHVQSCLTGSSLTPGSVRDLISNEVERTSEECPGTQQHTPHT